MPRPAVWPLIALPKRAAAGRAAARRRCRLLWPEITAAFTAKTGIAG